MSTNERKGSRINISDPLPRERDDSINSEHEAFLHPNMMRGSETEKRGEARSASYFEKRKKKFNTCKACFRRFDELILKPILIHNYDKVLQAKKNEFMMLVMPDWQEQQEAEQEKADEVVLTTAPASRRLSTASMIY